MKILSALVLAISISTLTGCSLFTTKEPEKVVVKEIQYVKTEVPESLLTDCVPDKPISKPEYMVLTPVEREQYLTDYSISLLGVINICNGQLKGIRKIVDQVNKPVKEIKNDS